MATVSTLNIVEIHEQATTAAVNAAQAMFDKINGDRFACGFAWCKVDDVRSNSKLGKELAKIGFRKDYTRGLVLWNPSKSYVQNIDIKEAGANAYAAVLRNHGINAYAQSRLD